MLPTRFPKRTYGLRAIATFLALSFTLSDSALALRTENINQSDKGKAGLEEALRSAPSIPTQAVNIQKPSLTGMEERSPVTKELERSLVSSNTTAGLEEFNPGHGKRLLKKLQDERRKLEEVLVQRNQSLTLRFINAAHGHYLPLNDISGFRSADFVSFELPPSTVEAFLTGRPTVIRKNKFWTHLLEGSHAVRGSEGTSGFFGVDAFAPARHALRRLIYYYSTMDLSLEGESQRKIAFPAEGSISPSEERILSRLSSVQRKEFEQNRLLYLHKGELNPLGETGRERLEEDLVFYRPPHPSIQKLMNQLQQEYGKKIIQMGVPRSQLSEFLAMSYFTELFVLLRDQMQLRTMYRRLQTRLKKAEGAPLKPGLLALHIGGSSHFEDLWALAALGSRESGRVTLDSQDDPRFQLFGGGVLKGSSFFAKRFEEVMDHVRIREDGEIELDTPYFQRLFGDFVESERRHLLEFGFLLSVMPPTELKKGSNATVPIGFGQLWGGINSSGALSKLTDADLLTLINQTRSVNEPYRRLSFLWRRIAKPPYVSIPGMKVFAADLRVQIHAIEFQEAFNRGNYLGAGTVALRSLAEWRNQESKGLTKFSEHARIVNKIIEAHTPPFSFSWSRLKQSLEFDPYGELFKHLSRDDADWLSLARSHQEDGDYPAAIAAFKREIQFNPTNAAAWALLGFSQYKLDDLSAADASFERAAQLDPSRFSHRYDQYHRLLEKSRQQEQSGESASGLEEGTIHTPKTVIRPRSGLEEPSDGEKDQGTEHRREFLADAIRRLTVLSKIQILRRNVSEPPVKIPEEPPVDPEILAQFDRLIQYNASDAGIRSEMSSLLSILHHIPQEAPSADGDIRLRQEQWLEIFDGLILSSAESIVPRLSREVEETSERWTRLTLQAPKGPSVAQELKRLQDQVNARLERWRRDPQKVFDEEEPFRMFPSLSYLRDKRNRLERLRRGTIQHLETVQEQISQLQKLPPDVQRAVLLQGLKLRFENLQSTGTVLNTRLENANQKMEKQKAAWNAPLTAEIGPQDAISWENLGTARLESGDFKGAIDAYREAQLLKDSNPEVRKPADAEFKAAMESKEASDFGAAELEEKVERAVSGAVQFLAGQGTLLVSLVGDQVMPVAPYFPDSSEMAELGRLNVESFVVPSRLNVPSAVQMPTAIRLLVQPRYEGNIQGQMAGVSVEMVTDPAQADFVIGDAAFVQSQRANPSAAATLLLQVDDPALVERITPLLLAHILARRDLFPAGTVVRIGTLVTGDLSEGLLLFA